MVNIYYQNDDGAEIDKFWGTAKVPSSRLMNQEEVISELKKSFHKNATKLDFTTSKNGITYVLGKIGTNENNTEYRIWKSENGMHDFENCVDINSSCDEMEAIKMFWDVAGESYRTYCRTDNNGMQCQVFESEVTDREIDSDPACSAEDMLVQMLLSDFARNANKVDYAPIQTGETVIVGFIGKSVDDEKSVFRVWKTFDHFKNDSVKYITEKVNKEKAMEIFRKSIG